MERLCLHVRRKINFKFNIIRFILIWVLLKELLFTWQTNQMAIKVHFTRSVWDLLPAINAFVLVKAALDDVDVSHKAVFLFYFSALNLLSDLTFFFSKFKN